MPALNVEAEDVHLIRAGHVVRTGWPAGAVHSRSVYPASRVFVRRWRLLWSKAGRATWIAVRDLWLEVGGIAGIFSWVPIGESIAIDCRFLEPLRWRQQNATTWELSILIEELG